MRLVEISKNAAAVGRKLEQLWVEYSVKGIVAHEKLRKYIDEHINSSDIDIANNASLYRNRLYNELIEKLR